MNIRQWVSETAPDLVVFESARLLGFRRKLSDVYCWVVFRSTSREDLFLARVGSSYMGTLELAWPFTPFTVSREFEVRARPHWLEQLEEIFSTTREQLLADVEVRKIIATAARGGGRLDLSLLEHFEDGFLGYLSGYLDQAEKLEQPPELDNLLEQLRSQGVKESEGSFTVDIRKAREKLRDYQLASPEEFIVHLLAAGAAGQAEQIVLHVDADDIIVELRAAPLEEAELESLVGVLMQTDPDLRTLMKQELVLALNSASLLKPRWLYLDSSSWRRDLSHGWEQPLQSLESPIPATRVHFRRPLGLEVVDRFLRALGGEHPELAAMRRRCPHLPVPVRMGKKELSHPIDCTTFKAVWHFRHSECRLWLEGRAEHHFERESPGLYSIFIGVGGPANGLVLQRNGLVYERPEVACKLPFVVVEAPYLPTDLSHLKLVDSSAFGRFRQDFEAIEAQVFEQIVEELADECRDQILRWAIERVKQVQKVACIPRLGSTSISWRAFLAEREVERYYTSRDWPHPPLPDDQIYVIAESNLEAVAHKVKLVCADERLEKARQWWNRHQQWLKLPTSPVALEVPCLTTTRTEIDDIHLLLGLHQVPTPGLFGSVLALRAQGRPLETLENELLPAGVVASINDPSLRMDADWAHVERDQTFSRVINNLHTLLPDLYRQALNQDPENDQLKVHLIYYAAFNLSPERWRDMPPWFYELKLFRLRNGRCLTLNQLQKKVYSRGLELDPGVWAKPAVDLLLKVIRR